MSRKIGVTLSLALVFSLIFVTLVQAAGGSELAKLRLATAPYKKSAAAQAAGYDLLPGLDYCFESPGVGAMGYHYINAAQLDLALDPLRPEAMVYQTGRNGKLKLVAVEFIVPAADWDAAGNTMPPEVLGQHLHLNTALGVYVLHAWIWKANPNGVFADWNPRVQCP